MNVKEGLSVKIQDSEQQLSGIIKKHEEEKQISETVEHLGGLAKTFFGETELTYEIAQALIQNVYVYSIDRIVIKFRFEDEIKKLIACSDRRQNETKEQIKGKKHKRRIRGLPVRRLLFAEKALQYHAFMVQYNYKQFYPAELI